MKKYLLILCSLFLGIIFPSVDAFAYTDDKIVSDINGIEYIGIFSPEEVFPDSSIDLYSDTFTIPSWYSSAKESSSAYVEYRQNWGSEYRYYLYDLSKYSGEYFTLRTYDNTYGPIVDLMYDSSISDVKVYSFIVKGSSVTPEYTGTNSSPGYITIKKTTSNYVLEPLTYKGIGFNTSSGPSPDDVFPPPPSYDEEGNYGYKFIYPLDGDIINLHAGKDTNYYEVPFKVDVKNFFASTTNKAEEFIKDSTTINTYKTVVNSIVWSKKPNILGSDVSYTVEGVFYIPITSLNNEINLLMSTYHPSANTNWISHTIKVKFTSDGSLPEYTPDSGGNNTGVDSDGNITIGGTDYGEIPKAPTDGSVTDWFAYIGNLIFWLITYPFKLLGNIISTLTGYITNMFSILQPVTDQLNSVLSFIPQDILNVCWGFLSFTILYSVLKSAFKMIRG